MALSGFLANFQDVIALALKTDAALDAREFNGVEVKVRASDGRMNMSSLAAAANKRVHDYIRLHKTRAFIETSHPPTEGRTAVG